MTDQHYAHAQHAAEQSGQDHDQGTLGFVTAQGFTRRSQIGEGLEGQLLELDGLQAAQLQAQIADPWVHELGVLDLLENLELLRQGASPQIDGQATLILQVLYRRLQSGRLSDTQAVLGPQDVILQLLESIGLGTLILGLQRLDPVLPDGV
ncbi:hypothetical protein D3C76_1384870 [compost metagenome]